MTWSNATYFLEFNCYWKTFLIQWHKWGYWSPVCTIDNHNNFTYIWEAKISLLTKSNIPLLVFTSMLREINNTMIFVWGWGKWACLSQVSKDLIPEFIRTCTHGTSTVPKAGMTVSKCSWSSLMMSPLSSNFTTAANRFCTSWNQKYKNVMLEVRTKIVPYCYSNLMT